MKKRDSNELRQPTSRLISWFIIPSMNCFKTKKAEPFLDSSSLVACPFQTQYSSKSWLLLQEYLVVCFNIFDHKYILKVFKLSILLLLLIKSGRMVFISCNCMRGVFFRVAVFMPRIFAGVFSHRVGWAGRRECICFAPGWNSGVAPIFFNPGIDWGFHLWAKFHEWNS